MREMKDSGSTYIGYIPEDWDLYFVKHLFNIGRGRVISEIELEDDGIYPVYSSQTKNDGCMGYINTYDYDLDQLTWTTDGVYAGTVFIRQGKHNCTNVCGTLQPILKNKNNLKYMKYALEYVAVCHRRKDINGGKIMNNEMARIKIPIPSLQDQYIVADFLDEKCGEIDTLTKDIQEQIETLQEYKKSIITEAVTKGLDPDVEMKKSLSDFTNMIPVHWNECKIKHHCIIKNGSDPILEGEIPVYGSGTEIAKYCGEYKTGPTILLGRKGTLDKPKIIYGRFWNVDTAMDMYISDDSNFKYIYYLTTCFDIKKYSTCTAKPSMTKEAYMNMIIPYPSIIEQDVLVDYLDNKCSQIDQIIQDKQQQIDTLAEYKKSLIYEYVTGKKEVQNV